MKWKPIVLGSLGVVVALLGAHHANDLLASKTLTGTEFVWLTGIYLATGLLVAILPKVTELSFSSLSLKLAAAEKVAEVTLEQLKQGLELSFIPAVASVTESPGNQIPGPQDERIAKFLILSDAIEKAGLRVRFARELADAARVIAAGQLRRVGDFNPAFMAHLKESDALPTPADVKAKLYSEKINSSSAWYQHLEERDQVVKATEAVDAYTQMYAYTLIAP